MGMGWRLTPEREAEYAARERASSSCGVCGKPALYRWLDDGRCAAHRLVKSDAHEAREARIRGGRAAENARWAEIDAQMRRNDGTRRFHRARRKCIG